jgi:hypothetical protein
VTFTRRLLSIATAGGLAGAGLLTVAPVHVFAGSGASTTCSDNNAAAGWSGHYGTTDDIPLLGGPYGAGGSSFPMTLGVEIATDQGLHVALCYSTSPYSSTGGQVSGGAIAVDALTPPSGVWSNPTANKVNAVCMPDATPQGEQLSCQAATSPTYSITPGPAGSTGDVISVNVPFTVCFGGCSGSSAALAPTGLLVGQLVPVAQPGIGVGYTLQSLQVIVNGVVVVNQTPSPAAAYVDPFRAVEESLDFTQGGPCTGAVCVPQGYVGTTGNNVAGFSLLGISYNVGGPLTKQCVYWNPSTNRCP